MEKTQILISKIREVALLEVLQILKGKQGNISEQLYDNKFCNLDEMGKFIKRPNIPNFMQEETDNLTCPVSIKEI